MRFSSTFTALFLCSIIICSLFLFRPIVPVQADNNPTAALFLKIDGLKGNSQNPNHKDEFDIHSFNWDESIKVVNGGGGGGGAGKPTIGEIQFTLNSNSSSPKILQSLASGQHIKTAALTIVEPNGEQLKIKLTDIVFTTYKISGNDQYASPLDQIGLNFAKIEMEHIDKNNSSSKGGWDVKANKSV